MAVLRYNVEVLPAGEVHDGTSKDDDLLGCVVVESRNWMGADEIESSVGREVRDHFGVGVRSEYTGPWLTDEGIELAGAAFVYRDVA